MGYPKALLLTREGRSFVASIAAAFDEAGISDIVVVTGRDHLQITDALSADAIGSKVRVVRNPDSSRGQLSSLLTGMDAAITDDTPALVVTLVDVPLLAADTVRRVMSEWARTRAPIVRPAIGERHGHPVVFDRSLFGELRNAPAAVGAKAVVRAHAAEIMNVPVTDEGCLVDVDTPGDYDALAR